ncbi:MAG: peptide chain release factor N(5)-glutamine methyltransferase, partial [Anaerococcus vaginalis]|nr:peptide chain release factor N(5)-glutamine methyltransferase [Anaerococcus vaginalis]
MKIKDILEKNNNDLIIALTYLLNTNKNLLFLNKEEALDEKIENELKIINDKINERYPLQYAIGKWN